MSSENSFLYSLIPQRTLEGRCCLLSSSQFLAPTTGKAGPRRALLCAAPKNTQRGRGAKRVRQLDRKTDPDRLKSRTAIELCSCIPSSFQPFSPSARSDPRRSPNQEDAQILTARVPVVLPVAGIFGYFGGAVGTLFLLLVPLDLSETCGWWEATGFHGENVGSPGCQHPQSDQSPQRQLPLVAAGPLDHQRRLAGLPEVPNSSPACHQHYPHDWPPLKCLVVIIFITHAATLSGLSWSHPARFILTRRAERSSPRHLC